MIQDPKGKMANKKRQPHINQRTLNARQADREAKRKEREALDNLTEGIYEAHMAGRIGQLKSVGLNPDLIAHNLKIKTSARTISRYLEKRGMQNDCGRPAVTMPQAVRSATLEWQKEGVSLAEMYRRYQAFPFYGAASRATFEKWLNS
ncbi:MAG TPA: hypothetical protein VGP72_06490 [Planctomycetota bacterium]|jgi:hypothetical protein